MRDSDGRRASPGNQPGRGAGIERGERAHGSPVAVQHRAVDALNTALLDEILAINAAGIELLVQRAAQAPESPSPGATSTSAEAVVALPPGTLPPAWLALDPPQRRRLAAQPFLLFGLGFEDGAGWQVLANEVLATASPPRISESRPRTAPVLYARLLVHYAWHLARTAPLTAALVAGMASASAAALRACHVEHLDALADRGAQWLRPRWMDAPSLWNDLLRASRSEEGASLARSVALRAVQCAGAALAAAPRPAAPIDAGMSRGGDKIRVPL
jgi:hypothetical protein